MENGKEVLAKVVQLRTQLVSQGHPSLAGGNRSDDIEDPLLFSRHWRKRAALSYQRGSHLRGSRGHRAI